MSAPETTWRDRLWPALAVLAGVVAAVGTVAVTVAGFSLSFDASKAVAVAAHIRKDWAWLLPVSVDGALAVAAVVAVVMRHLKKGDVAWYPWVVVALGATISVACNALHAVGAQGETLVLEDPRVRAAVSAIPAIMLALSIHLLVMLVELVGEVVGKSARSDRSGRLIEPTDRVEDPIGSSHGSPPPTDSDSADRVDLDSISDPINTPDQSGLGSADRSALGSGAGSGPGSGPGTRSDRAGQSAGSGRRSSGRSGRRGRSRGRSDDELRIELARAQELELLPAKPSAEAIRQVLQCAPKKAAQLRDELRTERNREARQGGPGAPDA